MKIITIAIISISMLFSAPLWAQTTTSNTKTSTLKETKCYLMEEVKTTTTTVGTVGTETNTDDSINKIEIKCSDYNQFTAFLQQQVATPPVVEQQQQKSKSKCSAGGRLAAGLGVGLLLGGNSRFQTAASSAIGSEIICPTE
jgi:hypothetical protein